MDTKEVMLRIVEYLENQATFPDWSTLIQLFSMLASWITIIFLLFERHSKQRPYLQISFELVRSSLACLIIRNVGECPLVVSSIKLSKDFVEQLNQETQNRITSLETSDIKIFPKNFYVFSLDVTTGTILNNFKVKKLTLEYKYNKLVNLYRKYEEQSIIDFSQYASMLIYISEIDELKGSVDKLLGEVTQIKKLIPSTRISDTNTARIVE